MPVQTSSYSNITLTVLYNNIPSAQGLSTAWGFSCMVQGMEKTILFDTGGDGEILLSNMKRMNVDPGQVDVVFLSHIHWDHTGGLSEFLKANSEVTVYLLESFPTEFEDAIKREGAKTVAVREPVQIIKGVYSTGEMGADIKEQSMILKTEKGLIVVTGCAHPGIVSIVRHSKNWLRDKIYLVLGGFHLMGYSDGQVENIIRELKEMGVEKVAPSHCTGEAAMRSFEVSWGENILDGGCGAVMTLP
jgi:7,8-dihydropterin-6-yl-methyl-4-(beta-D-ribofuranosyl)aminobenzene 5'-phosphate synthase